MNTDDFDARTAVGHTCIATRSGRSFKYLCPRTSANPLLPARHSSGFRRWAYRIFSAKVSLLFRGKTSRTLSSVSNNLEYGGVMLEQSFSCKASYCRGSEAWVARDRRPKDKVDEADDRGKALERDASREAMISTTVAMIFGALGRDSRTRRRLAGSRTSVCSYDDRLRRATISSLLLRANEPLLISDRRLFPEIHPQHWSRDVDERVFGRKPWRFR